MSVPTKSFSQILHSIAHRLEFAPSDLTTTQEGHFADYITAAVKLAWESYPWPDAQTSAEESIIAHPDITGARYIPKSNATRTLTQVSGIWNKNPLIHPEASHIQALARADGYYIRDASLTSVWIDYRPAPPEFTSAVYDSESEYTEGDLVWDKAGTGHVYRALQDVTDEALTETDFWQKQTILQCLAEPVKAGVIGTHNAAQGNHGTQRMKISYMEELLEHEILQLTNQGNQ